MKFFENLFKIPDNNYYGVSGLTLELNCIYIYNTLVSGYSMKENIHVC